MTVMKPAVVGGTWWPYAEASLLHEAPQEVWQQDTRSGVFFHMLCMDAILTGITNSCLSQDVTTLRETELKFFLMGFSRQCISEVSPAPSHVKVGDIGVSFRFVCQRVSRVQPGVCGVVHCKVKHQLSFPEGCRTFVFSRFR